MCDSKQSIASTNCPSSFAAEETGMVFISIEVCHKPCSHMIRLELGNLYVHCLHETYSLEAPIALSWATSTLPKASGSGSKRDWALTLLQMTYPENRASSTKLNLDPELVRQRPCKVLQTLGNAYHHHKCPTSPECCCLHPKRPEPLPTL